MAHNSNQSVLYNTWIRYGYLYGTVCGNILAYMEEAHLRAIHLDLTQTNITLKLPSLLFNPLLVSWLGFGRRHEHWYWEPYLHWPQPTYERLRNVISTKTPTSLSATLFKLTWNWTFMASFSSTLTLFMEPPLGDICMEVLYTPVCFTWPEIL